MPGSRYSVMEEAVIRGHYETDGPAKCEQLLTKRSRSAITKKANSMGLYFTPRNKTDEAPETTERASETVEAVEKKPMARGINKVILVGTLGKDPEVRYMPSGGAVANVTLATNESWKDKNTGQIQERTEWHRVVFFNRLAEIVGQYLKKGSQVYVEGSLQTRKWQGQDGQDRYTTEIKASEMQMLGGGSGAQNSGAYGQRDDAPKPEDFKDDDYPF